MGVSPSLPIHTYTYAIQSRHDVLTTFIIFVRIVFSDWYDELSCVESYDDATNLMYMVMKGTLSSK